ncbi:Ger(x)C family spore germination protein [Paenibacillus sp. GCM10012306]|uniref:Ger(x)C family spore germination protein n=1 Tax=Paenibacillus sp. GCM10012306 TaxID=3317342 RepID=UPI00361384A1
MKQILKQGCSLSLLLAVCLLLSSCWSSSPIEDVNMEAGVALDIADETETEQDFAQKGGEYPKRNKVSCTYQFLIPQGAIGSKKEGAQSKNYYNATQTGDSIFEAVRELSLRSNRLPIGHHLKTIVIGEELARTTKLSELIEFFSRDNDIRPSVLLLISKGKAREVFRDSLPGQTPAFVLNGTFNNRKRITRIWEPVSMAKVVGPLHGHTSFVLQNVIVSGKETKFSGVAVIKGTTGKLGGFLDEGELDGLIWITGKGKGGAVKTYNPDNNKLVTYEITDMDSKIKPSVKGDKISFHVSMESEGRIAEAYIAGGERLQDGTLKQVRKAIEKKVQDIAESTVHKLQYELQADVAGFGKSLQIQYPSVWNKVKGDWDEVFSNVPVTYEVKLNIEDYGASSTTVE